MITVRLPGFIGRRKILWFMLTVLVLNIGCERDVGVCPGLPSISCGECRRGVFFQCSQSCTGCCQMKSPFNVFSIL